MLTIVGSGFGIYGYLPALMVGLKEQVVLPQKYRFKILARPELKEFASGIEWVENEETALARASGVVIAVPPVYQPEIIARCLQLPRLNYLLVEKPLATSPSLADQTLDLLLKSKKTFRIAYSFLGTSWCNTLRLREHTRHDKHISIAWQFMAHHFRHGLHNWKRLHAQGGGSLTLFWHSSRGVIVDEWLRRGSAIRAMRRERR